MAGIGAATVPGSSSGGGTTQDINVKQVGGSTFSLGQQVAAASLPVVLTATQITTLTPLSTVTVTQGTSPWVSSLTDGTNTANILKSDGTAAGQNAQLIGSSYLSVAFTTTTAQAVGTTDAGNYRYFSVQVTSQGGSSTINFQGSNDNSTWVAVTAMSVAGGSGSATATNTSATGLFAGPLNFRYFRLNVTGIVSGTTAGTIVFTQTSSPIGAIVQVTESGTWTVGSNSATGSGVPANAFYQGAQDSSANLVGLKAWAHGINTATGLPAAALLAEFDDTSPTGTTENQAAALRISANRNLYDTIRDAAGNERGANVTVGNALVVDGSASTQPVSYATTGSGTATGALRVELANNGTGVMTSIGSITSAVTPGTAAANLGKAEDAAHASGDTGVFALAVRNDNLATTYGADQDYSPIAVDLNARVMVAQKAATGTLSNVSASASSVTVLAANSARIGAQISNDSSVVAYFKFGSSATASSYTVSLAGSASAPFSYYEVPAGYTGIITGLSASATGTYRVTEET